MEFLKYLGFFIIGIALGRMVVRNLILPPETTPEQCKLHNWDYDMETGKYVCIRCRGRSGEM